MSRRLRRGLSAMLLPLSAVPVAVAMPAMVDDYGDFSRTFKHRDALPAPAVALTAGEQRAIGPVARSGGRIPVLVYHGISDDRDRYSVTRAAFAEQMAMLDRAGFQTVSAEQYARALAGEDVELPERPVLVTFDDGYTSSFRGADRVLQRHGFRATMFVMSGQAGQRTPAYLRWDELRGMTDGGRWDVQLHAGDGHRQVPVDDEGHTGPFYASRKWSGGERESRDAAYRRITADLSKGAERLRKELPGAGTWTFSVPFGALGPDQPGGDAALTRQVGGWLKQRYAATFLQRNHPRRTRSGDAHRLLHRQEVQRSTTTLGLYRWLCACDPTEGRT